MYHSNQTGLQPLREQIISAVNTIQTYEELSQINSFIRREEIRSAAERALDKKIKRFHTNLDDRISKSLSNMDYSFEEKYKLLQTVYESDGLWDAAHLVKYKEGNIKTLIRNTNLNSMLIKDFGKSLILDFTGNLGFNSATIGAGEFFIAFTGRNADFADKGDLNIAHKLVEVKATVKGKEGKAGGRLTANTGYRPNTSVKLHMIPVLTSLGIPQTILDVYGWGENKKSSIMGGFNLNQSGLSNLSEVCRTYLDETRTKRLLTELITCMYYDTSLYSLDGIMNSVAADGGFCVQTLQIELVKLAHVYYAAKEDHDAILYFNTDNWNYVLVDSPDQYDELITSGKLRLTSGLDFNEDRSKGSTQILVA